METGAQVTRSCWCGNEDLAPWHGDYARCDACGTLVDCGPRPESLFQVADDGSSLYDASYWREKMGSAYKAMGCDSMDDIFLLHYRERAAYWIKHFVRHVLPPARVYEVGCGMGTFAKWLQDLGYDAVASELSPSWRQYLRDKLGIRALPPEEAVREAAGKPFDSVAMMDVLEHLPDPAAAVREAISLMTGTGQLMVQVPMYPEGASYESLERRNHPFLRMLLPGEHLFLYSRPALVRLLAEAGLSSLTWYQPIFGTDMFVFASSGPHEPVSAEEAETRLMTDPRAVTACAALKNAELLEREKARVRLLERELRQVTRRIADHKPLPAPESVNHVLYVRLDGIGDSILSGCLLENLPRLYRRAMVTVVCDKAAAALYQHAPGVQGVLALDKNGLFDESLMHKALSAIAALDADVIFNGVISPTADACALMEGSGLPIVTTEVDTANISLRVKERFEARAAKVVPLQPGPHTELDRYISLLEGLGVPVAAAKPRMWLTDADTRAAGEFWRECGFAPEKTVALFAGGGVSAKSYFRYGDALGELFAREGLHVAALGGPRDNEVNAANLAAFARCGVPVANFCGKGNMRTDAAFLRDCALAVGADTALAHAACAVDTPLAVLLPGVHGNRFFPYAENTVAICLPLECYNCNWKCRYKRAYCVAGIRPETVRQAVKKLLSERDGRRAMTLFMQAPGSWPQQGGLPAWQSPGDFIAAYKKRGGLKVAVGGYPR